MDKTVAYAVWRNPKADNNFEIVGIPIKTIRGKVTLLVRHPAFAGVRLDPTLVDFEPASALRRFVERRTQLAARLKEQLDQAERDVNAVSELIKSDAGAVRILEDDQWASKSNS